jgi:phosphomannomutase
MSVKFGTDGWRAVISDEFTFENVRLVAQAIADMFRAEQNGSEMTFVVGYDTRFLSDRYAKTVAGVLAANGIRVLLTERFAATPAVSYAIVRHEAAGGVMITASHNPPRYNGLKLKAAYGGSASPADSQQVEQTLLSNLRFGKQPREMPLEEGVRQGLITYFDLIPTTPVTSAPWWTWRRLPMRSCASLSTPCMARAWDTPIAFYGKRA